MSSLAYACALSRDILIQGRLFVGEEHVCFYANILGWITSVVIAYRDIVSIDKRNTAVIFPNAIQVATLHHRYFFASFMYREEAYKQLQAAWKQIILGAVHHIRGYPLSFCRILDVTLSSMRMLI